MHPSPIHTIVKRVLRVDVQHDSPQVHPENCCHRCRGMLYHAAKRENSTDITGSQREAFHWSEHSSGECCICKHIAEMVNLKWVERRRKKTERMLGDRSG